MGIISKREIANITTTPWGYYEVLTKGDGYKVKFLVVFPGKRTSLQYHTKREEWITNLDIGYTIHFPKYTEHRLEEGRYIEVQLGECEESDIVRLDDDYGRYGEII